MRIGIANAAEVDALWPSIGQKVQATCDKSGGDMSSGDLWQMCRSGQAFLVVVMDDDQAVVATIILQFQKWNRRTVLRCLSIDGERMSEWLQDAMAYIENMGRNGGASSLISEGREGWARVLPQAKKLRITYEVEI